jgi:MYXO-CTERM domain-containing protein
MTGSITLKNVGTATWRAGVSKLAPTPRDKPSSVGSTGWLSPTRVSSPSKDVPTGQSYAFPLTLTAGAPGTYVQTFSLVEEGVTWFADAPAGGGPPDNRLAVKVVVTGPGGGTGGSGAGGGGQGASGTGGGGVGGGTGAGSTGANKGCGCRAAGEDGGPLPAGAWLAVAGMAAVAARRRRA